MPLQSRPFYSLLGNQTESQHHDYLGLALIASGSFILGSQLAWQPSHAEEKSQQPPAAKRHLIPLAQRQRLYFQYEKRLRDNSSLDKVFEYFSSNSSDTHRDPLTYMLPADVLRAIVATYPASRSSDERGGSLPGERRAYHTLTEQTDSHSRQSKLLMQFDMDGDGEIHFEEFVLLITLLSISISNIETVFSIVDEDGSGAVDATEFAAVLRLLQERHQSHNPRLSQSSRSSGGQDDEKASGLLVAFFGHDQKGTLAVEAFKTFLAQLHKEVVRLEFEHYLPDDKNTILGVDFARSLAASCHTNHVDTLLDRIESLDPKLLKASITLSDFECAYKLQAQVDKLTVAIDFLRQLGRPLTRHELQTVCKRVAGVDLSPHVLDIIMAVFQDGSQPQNAGPLDLSLVHLDAHLFIEALSRKAMYNLFKASKSQLSASSKGSFWSSWTGGGS